MGARGKPKTGGRTKGTPNKKTQLLQEKLDEAGVDPFRVLSDLCLHHDAAIRGMAAKELCQYILPKRKALDLHADVDVAMLDKAKEIKNLPKNEKIKLLEDELKKLKNE